MAKQTNIASIILAAGQGTRMNSRKSKILHEVADKTLVAYITETTTKLNGMHNVAVVGDKSDDVQKEISLHNDKTRFVIQKEQLGTAHAVKICEQELKDFDGTIIVLYGDTPFITKETISKMHKKITDKNSLCVLALEVQDPTGYGRLVIERKKLKRIVEEKDASEDEKKITLCNSGVMAISGKHLWELLSEVEDNNANKEFYLTDIIEIAVKKKLGVTHHVAEAFEVMGINSKLQLAQAEMLVQDLLREKALDDGVQMLDPSSVYLSHDVKFGKDVLIEQNVVIKGDVKIYNNVTIRAFSHIENAVLRDNVTVGPYARIRPNTTLNRGAKIGNFVEVKNSQIGDNSKAGHLSYIGDAKIGRNVNIGAGVVTCNYDGENKHRTNIYDNCFIGSNTEIIAPVTIGKHSVIGAGTTILEDVERGSKIVNSKEMKNLSNGQKSSDQQSADTQVNEEAPKAAEKPKRKPRVKKENKVIEVDDSPAAEAPQNDDVVISAAEDKQPDNNDNAPASGEAEKPKRTRRAPRKKVEKVREG